MVKMVSCFLEIVGKDLARTSKTHKILLLGQVLMVEDMNNTLCKIVKHINYLRVLSRTNLDDGWHKPCNVQNNKTYNFVVLCGKISFYGGGHEMWNAQNHTWVHK